MMTPRALVIAVAALSVFWLAFDSGLVHQAPAPAGRFVALAILGMVFAVSAFVMQVGGQTKRVPLFFGLALGVGTYLLLRTLTP